MTAGGPNHERSPSSRLWRVLRVRGARGADALGIIAAVVVVVLINVAASRRYARWDLTSNERYTLSPATVQTLRDLADKVEVWVLLGPADPLEQSVKQLLVAYQAETTKLDIHYVDPDRDIVLVEDVRKRFKIETGRTEEGHVVADAVVVVARGERHWFVTSSELVEIASPGDTQVKPREERALTGAIRNVIGGSKTKICFTAGHGESSPLDLGDRGASRLKDVLEKDNYEVAVVDLASPGNPKPLDGCGVAIVAGLRGAFSNEEAERLRTWLLADGNLFLSASPILVASDSGERGAGAFVSPGLGRVVGPFGISLDDVVVAERDAATTFPDSGGFRFVAQPKEHAITRALVKTRESPDVPRILVELSRSLGRAPEAGAASPQELLATSSEALGLRSLERAADATSKAAERRAGDLSGPLAIAMAAERPKTSPSAQHGPRVVVIGTASVVTNPTFREPLPFRGGALFVESAISWLASKPQVLDVPDKKPVGAGVRFDEEGRAAIRRYVVVFIPATVAVLGAAVAFFRRGGQAGRERERERHKKRKRREPDEKGRV